MNELLADLNPEQRELALHRGHCLGVACPGSGKSKTLASKAASLLQEGAKIGAVTFTREAALELRDRIVTLAGPTCKSRLLVGTFHSIDMLMAFPQKFKGEYGRSILAGMKSPFSAPWNIVKEGVRRSYIIRAMRESGLNITLDEATSIIELLKDAPNSLQIEEEKRVMVEIYTRLMEESKHIDFQDIILNTNAALRNKTLTPLAVDSLLVDEFQDTDNAQYEWCMHHGKAGIPITAVGDDDQSIYGFRRALGYAGMDKFAREFNALRVLLGTNYRCRSEILGSAEKLIRRNTQRIEKVLHAAKGAGGIVQWESFKDSTDECNAVAQEAIVARMEQASFAVIARTNRELEKVQAVFNAERIPYKMADGKSIFDRPEIQVYAAIMRTILKPVPNDIDHVLAWAGMTEEDTLEVRRMFGNNVRIGSTVDFKNSKMTKHGIDIWRSFAKKHAEWVRINELGQFALLDYGIWEWLSETLQKPHSIDVLEAGRLMFTVRSVDGSLAEVLQKLRDAEMKQKEAAKDGANVDPKSVVWLMTAHGSKGLEFDRVWIVGLQTGTFPSDKSSLEEERRLMFVAMTRAREMLWVSATREKKPSVFVLESELLAA